MGNCCASPKARKKKVKQNQSNMYDPHDSDALQKMITNNDKHGVALSSTSTKSTFSNNNNNVVDDGVIEEAYNSAESSGDDDDDDDGDGNGAHQNPHHRRPHAKSAPPLNTNPELRSSGKVFPKFKKPLSAIPTRMLQEEGFSRQKHNSTSSLYINSTLSTPDNDELLRCMAQAVLYHIEKGVDAPKKSIYDIFNEEKYPITKAKLDCKKMPDVEMIYKFLAMIFKAERLDAECGIMCLAYIERMISCSGFTLDQLHWRRVVLSALILASKVWEDQSVWNVDFLPVFDNLTAKDLNKMERQFLALLQYNVSLNASMYAKYYFELRTFSKLDSEHFPLKPLDRLNAKRLEDHSMASEYRVKTFKRSASVDQLEPINPHRQAILN
eukprot:TRINITY_DN2723_c0_g1_i1.p1 TRINITY_DN2723_c0_g1~~TRINITY_DN2723_c0_g1_i1.p1  ORF type:complete len:383 (-),score=98.19 TRINITY_DN2723_c0_g1_i1:213-1361(-)